MRRYSTVAIAFLGIDVIVCLAHMAACGADSPAHFSGGNAGGSSPGATAGGVGGSNGEATAGGTGGGISISNGVTTGGAATGSGGTTGGVCPAGLSCNVPCTGTPGTTTIKGVVYDPAGKNPLPNIAVYVPATPLVAMDKGVPPQGSKDFCSCGALYKSGAITNTSTLIDGSFELKNVPVPTTAGGMVDVVIQVGKWRRKIPVAVTACQENQAPAMWLPSTVPAGDTDTNMPDIAVSTGSSDSLECLMRRIGLPTGEYVAGTGTSGHVHVFAGGTLFGAGGGPEIPAMPGTSNFPSPTTLWASQAQLMHYDIVLLSCEGDETYNANPSALEEYLNAGGRAFASHYHYAWFSGPLESGQSYSAPADWRANLATWTQDDGTPDGPVAGVIDPTLNGSSQQFAKGVALKTWLGARGALGVGLPANQSTDLSIYSPRYNAAVSASNTPSQPWITSGNSTMYFSFDTPVNPTVVDGAPQYCGRAVFSDLHVAGDPSINDNVILPPPSGCDTGDLSPQEKALEFMLFDLSSCVIPDTVAPPDAGAPLPPPPQ